jgi:hypothetical protein
MMLKRQARATGRAWLYNLRARAKILDVPFDLTIEDLKDPGLCPLLELPLSRSVGEGTGGASNSPSVDRIIPALGYVKGNVRIISKLANAMKQDATPEQLLTFARNIVEYLKGAA